LEPIPPGTDPTCQQPDSRRKRRSRRHLTATAPRPPRRRSAGRHREAPGKSVARPTAQGRHARPAGHRARRRQDRGPAVHQPSDGTARGHGTEAPAAAKPQVKSRLTPTRSFKDEWTRSNASAAMPGGATALRFHTRRPAEKEAVASGP